MIHERVHEWAQDAAVGGGREGRTPSSCSSSAMKVAMKSNESQDEQNYNKTELKKAVLSDVVLYSAATVCFIYIYCTACCREYPKVRWDTVCL